MATGTLHSWTVSVSIIWFILLLSPFVVVVVSALQSPQQPPLPPPTPPLTAAGEDNRRTRDMWTTPEFASTESSTPSTIRTASVSSNDSDSGGGDGSEKRTVVNMTTHNTTKSVLVTTAPTDSNVLVVHTEAEALTRIPNHHHSPSYDEDRLLLTGESRRRRRGENALHESTDSQTGIRKKKSVTSAVGGGDVNGTFDSGRGSHSGFGKEVTVTGTTDVWAVRGRESQQRDEDDGEAKVEKEQLNGEGWVSSSSSESVNITTTPVVVTSTHQHHHHRGDDGGKKQMRMNLTVELEVGLGRHLALHLHPTSDLIAEGYNREAKCEGEQEDERRTCEYQGEVRGQPGSWAALSICRGLRGVVVVGEQQLLVSPLPGSSSLLQPHRIISANLVSQPGHCGVMPKAMHTVAEGRNDTHQQEVSHRVRRAADMLLGGPLWVLDTTRFVELVLVADNSFYLRHGSDTQARCRTIVNIVNAMYRPLGVVVVLSKLVVWRVKDEIEVLPDYEKNLDNLRDYREKMLASDPTTTASKRENDNTILITNVDFDGQTVGYATVAGMCGHRESVGVVQDSREEVGVVAQTLAHEMGHNLGMKHDEDISGCQCPQRTCVMSSISSHMYKHNLGWSSCSKKSLLTELKTSNFDCLKNVPRRAVHLDCGDGVVDVEGGEQCDCGPPEFCDNPCCNAETCQLTVNASCASGSCCNTETCQLRPQGEVCRPAMTDCDLPEFCSGISEFCRPDVTKANGEQCKTGTSEQGHCYAGECWSHERRCRQVWGPEAKVAQSVCYDLNAAKGDNTSNCGFTDDTRSYLRRCSKKDKMCGTLHCEKPMHTSTSLSHHVRFHTGYWQRGGHMCRFVIAQHNIPDSFWLAPSGVPCGEGKMCVDQRCVDVVPPEGDCSDGCSGHGYCNSKGHCHCDPGFAPPDCSSRGYGGSVDSNPSGRKRDPLLDAVFFVCFILLAVVLLLCCLWSGLRTWWEARGRSQTLPCCATCLDLCCCPIMTHLNSWVCSVICCIKKDPEDQKKPEPYDNEHEQILMDQKKNDRQFGEDPHTKISRLHQHEGGTADRPTYLQSVSVDSGCVLDEEVGTTTINNNNNTRPSYTSQMSMTSLINSFRTYRYQSRKGAPPKTDNSSSLKKFGSLKAPLPQEGDAGRKRWTSWRRFTSKKNVPLSRMVLDPSLGGSGQATRREDEQRKGFLQSTYVHSVAVDATHERSRGERAPPILPPPRKISAPILPPATTFNSSSSDNNNPTSSLTNNIVMRSGGGNDSLDRDYCLMPNKKPLQLPQKSRISPVRVAPVPPSEQQTKSPTLKPITNTPVRGSNAPPSRSTGNLPGRVQNNNSGPMLPPAGSEGRGKGTSSEKKPLMPPCLQAPHTKTTAERKPMMPPDRRNQSFATASNSRQARTGLPAPPMPPSAHKNVQPSSTAITHQPSVLPAAAVPGVAQRARNVKDLASRFEGKP